MHKDIFLLDSNIRQALRNFQSECSPGCLGARAAAAAGDGHVFGEKYIACFDVAGSIDGPPEGPRMIIGDFDGQRMLVRSALQSADVLECMD